MIVSTQLAALLAMLLGSPGEHSLALGPLKSFSSLDLKKKKNGAMHPNAVISKFQTGPSSDLFPMVAGPKYKILALP